MDDNRQSTFKLVSEVSKTLNLLEDDEIDIVLRAIATEIEAKKHFILSENQKDLQRIDSSSAAYNALLLDEERIVHLCTEIQNIAHLPSPIGKTISNEILDNGVKVSKVTVPYGVVGVIFESHPEYCLEYFTKCFKAGNACILKGSAEAKYSNTALVDVIRETLDANGINPNICTLLPCDRSVTEEMLSPDSLISHIIARGGEELMSFVEKHYTPPSNDIKEGVCHAYFHKDGDVDNGQKIIADAKIKGVLDCLLIHKDRLDDLYYLCKSLTANSIEIYADKQSYEALKGLYPADLLKSTYEDCYKEETGDKKLFIKTVWGIEDTIIHIGTYSSKKCEVIIAKDKRLINRFNRIVNAACIYANTPIILQGEELNFADTTAEQNEQLCAHKWLIEEGC